MVKLFRKGKYYIFGAGRHALEIYYLIQNSATPRIKISGFIVDNPTQDSFINIPVQSLNRFIEEDKLLKHKPKVIIAVGDTRTIERVSIVLREFHIPSFSVIHKSVNTKSFLSIGDGVTICNGSIFTTNIKIGNHSIINIGCTVSHDVIIGNCVNICPGVNISGGVSIEDNVFIGTGSVILPKVIIGKNSIVGAGAVVLKNIEENVIVAGNPARIIKKLF